MLARPGGNLSASTALQSRPSEGSEILPLLGRLPTPTGALQSTLLQGALFLGNLSTSTALSHAQGTPSDRALGGLHRQGTLLRPIPQGAHFFGAARLSTV